MYRRLLLVGFTLCLSGCVSSQKYSRPGVPVPNTWPGQATQQTPTAPELAAAEILWRDFFTDRKLQGVIDLALHNNRDLRMAALHVEKVQAAYRIQRAQQYPTVTASVSGDLYRIPENMMFAGMTIPRAVTMQQYTANLGAASWELDLFGRVRSLKEQALQQYLATQHARSATQIALVGVVASSYLTLAADHENLRLAEATLENQQATYELMLRRRDAGIGSDLELRQAQSQVDTARTEVARYRGQIELSKNALDLLAGAPVPADLLPAGLDAAEGLRDLVPGLPSELLLQRPDILMAEHRLKGAYANIGAARAAYFPRIALTAGTGFLSSDLSDLFKSGSQTWNFAPQAAIPIFDMGTRKANVKVAQVDRDLAIAEYEKSIQTAFREVSDALSLRSQLAEQQAAQEALLQTLGESYRLSEARYQAGIDSYLSVLVAQQSLYNAQQAMVGLRIAHLNNRVTLYKVLGGGA